MANCIEGERRSVRRTRWSKYESYHRALAVCLIVYVSIMLVISASFLNASAGYLGSGLMYWAEIVYVNHFSWLYLHNAACSECVKLGSYIFFLYITSIIFLTAGIIITFRKEISLDTRSRSTFIFGYFANLLYISTGGPDKYTDTYHMLSDSGFVYFEALATPAIWFAMFF